jgi:hemolysin III
LVSFASIRTCPPFSRPYDRAELFADGLVHAAGVGLALGGSMPLVSAADHLIGFRGASVWIYCLGLVTLFSLSALYNLWPVCALKWIFRRFDHSAIYLLIAATYTPFLARAEQTWSTIALLLAIWSIATLGIILKLAFPGRFERLSILLCLAMGWSGVLVYDAVFSTLPSSTVTYLLTGGVLYSAGVVFHLWDRLRFQNAIWHMFVLAAASFQYAAVFSAVQTIAT